MKTPEAIAADLVRLDLYEARDQDETVETIAAIIRNNPIIVIEYLTEIIEELQEGGREA